MVKFSELPFEKLRALKFFRKASRVQGNYHRATERERNNNFIRAKPLWIRKNVQSSGERKHRVYDKERSNGPKKLTTMGAVRRGGTTFRLILFNGFVRTQVRVNDSSGERRIVVLGGLGDVSSDETRDR